MENNKTNSLFFWGACLILFLPIVILPPTFQPADWSRTILLRIILTILACFLLFKFLYKKDISVSLPKWSIRAYLPFLILSAFFITLILSTIFSQDPSLSVFGSPTRTGGILNLLFFFILAIFLTLFVSQSAWKKLFNFLFITGVAISLFGLIQYFKIFKNIFVSYESGSTPSFLGSSAFLAIYMLFLSILAFVYFINEKETRKKALYGGLFLLFGFTILITGARATYLGLLAGFFFFFFFYPKKLRTLKIIAAIFVLLAVIAVVLFNFFPQIGEKNNLLKIVVNRLSIKRVATDLLGTRFSAWKITLQAIKDKPILGWGPENFYIGFEKHYDPTILGVKNMWWDRPHNVFLEIWVNSGIFALIFYTAFWAMILWRLQIFKRQQGDDKLTYLAHGVQAMFIGYLVALFFNFDGFSTYLISFFFVGYAFYLISSQEEKIIIAPPQNKIFQKKPVIIAFLVFVFLFLWFWNIKPLYLNEKISYIQVLLMSKKCEKAMIEADNIWENAGILKSYAGLEYADTIKKCVSSQPEKEADYVQRGYQALKSSSIAQPKFTRTWLFLGGFTNILAAKEQNPETQKKLLQEAIGYLKKGLELSPKRQEIIIEMEKSYLILKDYEAMKKIAYDCIKIDESFRQCYWYLGVAEIFLGDQQNGKKHIQEAEGESAGGFPYIQLGVAYISQKNYKDAAEAYRLAILFGGGKNASWHAVLAFLYKQIGEYEKASQSALEVFKLQPENKEVIEFLRQLTGTSPNNPNIHISLGYVYKQIGQIEKSRQEYLIVKSMYAQAVARYPNNSGYHLSLAGVYKELGEYEKAYQEAVTAENLDPDYHNGVSNFISGLPGDYWSIYTGKNK